MPGDLTKIRDDILTAGLPDVPFDGWTWEVFRRAGVTAGYSPDMAQAVFPGGIKDVVKHFADKADRDMLDYLPDPAPLKVRERISQAVMARLSALEPHREAERLAVSFWLHPVRKLEGARILWRTADRIWSWAGDDSTDYNRYTKRSLLCGVIAATTLAWLNDEKNTQAATQSFLDRRIENVMQLGKIAGKLKRA